MIYRFTDGNHRREAIQAVDGSRLPLSQTTEARESEDRLCLETRQSKGMKHDLSVGDVFNLVRLTNFEDIMRTVEIKALRKFHHNLYNQNTDSNRFNLRVPCPLCRNGELSLRKAAGPTIDPYDVSFEDGSQATREQQRKSRERSRKQGLPRRAPSRPSRRLGSTRT